MSEGVESVLAPLPKAVCWRNVEIYRSSSVLSCLDQLTEESDYEKQNNDRSGPCFGVWGAAFPSHRRERALDLRIRVEADSDLGSIEGVVDTRAPTLERLGIPGQAREDVIEKFAVLGNFGNGQKVDATAD